MKTALDHLPESKQNAIREIRRIILNEAEAFIAAKEGKKADGRVLWVVLFGSYARGTYVENPINSYYSDFDVLVVVNRSDLVEEYALWTKIEDKADRLTRSPLSLLIHSDAEVICFLEQQGHFFFKDIQEEGIYLYTSSGKPLPGAIELSHAQRLPVAQKHFDQWFKSAEEFLIAYDAMIANGAFKNASFQLHQATERFYACLLLVISNYRPSTHSIKHLHRLAMEYSGGSESPIAAIFPGETRFQRRCFNLLRRAYVDSRYSEHFDITREELDWLFDQVQQLKTTVKQVCDAHIQHLAALGAADEHP